ncbi:MAG: stage III sporulation protein AA [Clostridia bacterium]
MLKEYLDRDIYNLIVKSFSFSDITEIRMRVNQNIIIVVKSKKYYLKDDKGGFVVVSKTMIDNFIQRASQSSLYAFNDSIINGYITLPKGIRVGLSGFVVVDKENVSTIKDFQSVNIRIPHMIKNCSLLAYDYICDNDIKNTLIISSPGAGKTTFLRDIVYQFYRHNISKNVLIVDERSEISSVVDGIPVLDMGGFCDIYTNCSKEFGFKNGIRSMSPNVVVTDEIDIDRDMRIIVDAINSGVSVIATIHALDINQLKKKRGFDYLIDNKIFDRYIVLSNDEGPGTMTNIYDEKLNCIYCR